MGEPLLCHLEELADGEARGVVVETERGDSLAIILLRRKGRVLAYRNRCPHTGVNLEWLPDQFLDREGAFIQCATHGALFRPEDGYCVRGPCAGESLEKVEVELRDGGIYLLER